MSDDDDTIIQDQPLKVLGLFQKRQINTIGFNEQKFLKLYDNLCCTICQQLFNNPVYLRCSHRFCKQCIQKYIRINQKRSCPNCRGDLTTKRDLRTDFSLTTLINYAFGDRNKFCQQMQQIQNNTALTIQRNNSKSPILVRTKSYGEQQKKSLKKKVKINQDVAIQQIQAKYKKRKDKSIDNARIQESAKNQEQKNQNISQPMNQFSNKIQLSGQINKITIQQEIFDQKQLVQRTQQVDFRKSQVIKKKRGRKKLTPILPTIQVKSFSSQQIQQINLSLNKTNSVLLKQHKNQIQLNKKYSKQFNQNSKISARQLTRSTRQIQKISGKENQKQIFEAQNKFGSLQNQRKCLKQQFGENYMFKIMKIPILDFLLQIKLQRHPDCFITPYLACKSIQLSTKVKIHTIFSLLSKMLNINKKFIKLYTKSDKIIQLTYEQYKQKSVCQVNEELWKTVSDVDVFNMKDILSSLQDLRGQGNHIKIAQSQQRLKKTKLYEGVEIQKQIKPANVKKRGRGRAKKMQQKQNIQLKQQTKRIIYYKISTI